MTRIELAPEIGDDFERIVDHLVSHEVVHAASRLREIVEAIGVLETNPLIGWPAINDKRELVMGRGSHGYVALYRYVERLDTVFVLAVRGQREAGVAR
ncbi:type II toxin-antitoxin system RelE/ParE family toxin [Rhodanobacter glycinis]|uniref:Type II toxin-antitoxin system RelE/ParE family toxin n=1 Tax=Rhodanobacter glycinis TaxID=582702 RepID=A0A5B9DVF1_9GAMM|nr:type II toxin-antitoxin system RelE/ParE family toxin [Rhodanobacter glycinis]QEE23189.1 type II toxin-antitoxin system RelE/ParE family toxin [Rhodanobacter glycinis]